MSLAGGWKGEVSIRCCFHLTTVSVQQELGRCHRVHLYIRHALKICLRIYVFLFGTFEIRARERALAESPEREGVTFV